MRECFDFMPYLSVHMPHGSVTSTTLTYIDEHISVNARQYFRWDLASILLSLKSDSMLFASRRGAISGQRAASFLPPRTGRARMMNGRLSFMSL